jgi:Amt family ammonium transporter
MYTGSAHQLWEQFRAAIWVILWSGIVTFILMKLIGLVLGGVRYKDEILEVGDLAIHGEEAFPEETFATRSDGAFALAGLGESGSPPPIGSEPSPPPDAGS